MTRGQQLHARACSGEILSAEDRVALEDWYIGMDSQEAEMLTTLPLQTPTTEELRGQIDVRLSELQAALGEIRKIEERNEVLRRQNEELKKHLVSKGILVA